MADLRAKLADAECKLTKTEIQNKDLQAMGVENGSINQKTKEGN